MLLLCSCEVLHVLRACDSRLLPKVLGADAPDFSLNLPSPLCAATRSLSTRPRIPLYILPHIIGAI
jgi:hypothetical protein